MTNSEKLTSIIAKKFFLPQYIYTDIFVKNGKEEKEFCDCILEFESVYVVIQIKERGEKSTINEEQWFEKKVMKNAKKQLKDTFRFYKDKNNIIFSKSSEFVIDRDKTIIPVIVFLNANLPTYKRVIRSKSLGDVINIFSYNDFETMLQTVILPYDIIYYLQYRLMFENIRDGNVVTDNVDDSTTLLFRPHTEEDYAQMFLARNYYQEITKYNFSEELIHFYNHLVSEINKACGNDRSTFISGLLCVDYKRAATISLKYQELLESAKADDFVFPFTFTKNDRVYMFMVKPSRISNQEFDLYLERILIYLRYVHKAKLAHVVLIQYIEENQFSLEVGDIDLIALVRYDELVEETVKAMESWL